MTENQGTYEDYKAMIERNGFGEPMSREQWEATNKSDD